MLGLKKKPTAEVKRLEKVYEEAYEYYISAGMIDNLSFHDAYFVQELLAYIDELRRQ